MRDCSWLLLDPQFANATPDNFRCCSDRTDRLPCRGYNCIAWAAGKTDRWWWPIAGNPCAFWPIPVHAINAVTVEQFVRAFETEGYSVCRSSRFENSFEKVALFVDDNNEPTHAARMLPSGVWTSKMGALEDIEHDALTAVEGKRYGKAVALLKRPNDAFHKPLLSRIAQLVRTWFS